MGSLPKEIGMRSSSLSDYGVQQDLADQLTRKAPNE
jgi:hypothetical protein